MTFDRLVIDVSEKENHLFLEIVSPMAAGLNIPIIAPKVKLSNYGELVEALEAYVMSKEIETFELEKSKVREMLGQLHNDSAPTLPDLQNKQETEYHVNKMKELQAELDSFTDQLLTFEKNIQDILTKLVSRIKELLHWPSVHLSLYPIHSGLF